MKKPFCLFVVLTLVLALPVCAGEWRDVAPGDQVRLPQDLFFQKDYRLQWWYVTGHLFDQSGREFGFELTFFAVGVQKRAYRSAFGVNTIHLVHAAITDVAGNHYFHGSSADSGVYGFGGAENNRLGVWVGEDALEGSMKMMHLKARAEEAAIDLTLIPKKPVVLQGREGYSRKSEASPLDASLYFSLTDMETSGTVRSGDRVFPVYGKSWFDRELSSRTLPAGEAGWDWFALQFDDDREVMLYNLRKKDGTVDPFSAGMIVAKDGTYHSLPKDDFTVTVLDRYESAQTKVRYPSKWEIIVPSEKIRVIVTPLIRDQEFTGAGLFGNAYWEGACRVEGSVSGRAYVELTGYGK